MRKVIVLMTVLFIASTNCMAQSRLAQDQKTARQDD